jgi:signal transduction histidine kinase
MGGAVELWRIAKDRTARPADVRLEFPPQRERPNYAAREQKLGYQVICLRRTAHPGGPLVLAAAPWADDGAIDEGRVFAAGLSPGGESFAIRRQWSGGRFSSLLGFRLADVGDVNGDGRRDVLMAAPFAAHGQVSEGLAFLFAGTDDGLTREPVWAFEGDSVEASFGRELCALGDVNGDGFADFAVASPRFWQDDAMHPVVQVFYGAPGWPAGGRAIPLGRSLAGRTAAWWGSRWAWEKAVIGLSVMAGLLALGAFGHRQWQRRTVILVERRESAARQAERERLARDLHDEFGSRLSRIHVIAEQLRRSPAGEPGVVEAQSDRLSASARDLRHAMQQVVGSLREGADTMDGLLGLISRQADEFFAGTGVRCLQRIPVGLPARQVPETVRAHLLPCLREALNNVLRHARAQEVWVTLTWDPPALTLTVEDDGVGFAENAIRPGHGLANLRARMQAAGGECTITSAPNAGCRVRLRVELPNPAGTSPAR